MGVDILSSQLKQPCRYMGTWNCEIITKGANRQPNATRSIDNVARDLGIESFTITWYSDDPDETTEYSISGKIKEE